jgi:hypothetical protein
VVKGLESNGKKRRERGLEGRRKRNINYYLTVKEHLLLIRGLKIVTSQSVRSVARWLGGLVAWCIHVVMTPPMDVLSLAVLSLHSLSYCTDKQLTPRRHYT